MPYAVALFLAAHGLIHASYLSPRPAASGGPAWPFDMADSWAVVNAGLDVGLVRAVGIVLVLVTIAGFVLAALAAAGIVVPQNLWVPLVVGASLTSAVALGLFFHPWIVLGLVIDAALLYAVAVAGWHPLAAR